VKDPRHTDVNQCFSNTIAQRGFDGWTMTETTLPAILKQVPNVAGIDKWFRAKFALDEVVGLSERHSWMIEKIRKHYQHAS